jgi:hypothetical protein
MARQFGKQIGVYTIDEDVEIPDSRAIDRTKEYSLPPLAALEVGQSVLFPLELRKSVQTTASRIKKVDGKDFVVRKVDTDSARVWRTK